MGTVISIENNDIKTNNLLERFCGTESISDNDPYWNKLFSFNFNVSQCNRNAQKKFILLINDFLQKLLYNTLLTNNFSTLIRVFQQRLTELESSTLCKNKIFLWQTANALLIIRYICTFFAEKLILNEFINVFENNLKNQDENANKFSAKNFLQNLIEILCNNPVNDHTILIHCETIRTILALLSTQLYSKQINENSVFLQYFMKNQKCATNLVRILLENFLYHTNELPDETQKCKNESFVIFLATSMWTTFQKKVISAENSIKENNNENDKTFDVFPSQSLALLSLALLLSLVFYQSFKGKANVFKNVLTVFQNSQEVSSVIDLKKNFKLDYSLLYNSFCNSVDKNNMSMLLLYVLLHNNNGFQNYVLSRINLENLVLPCIKLLNSKFSNESLLDTQEIYLVLIILLILSEDDFFCKIIHETKIKDVSWYQFDYPVFDITLGSLIVIVLVKIIHINTVKIRDRYLHTNLLAALANMSTYFKHLSPLVCQKLLGLLETMTKRQKKLILQLVKLKDYSKEKNDLKIEECKHLISEDQTKLKETNKKKENLQELLNQDINALEEGIQNILEIINACLTNNLRSNTNLIYAILYQQKLFESFKNCPLFENLLWNIYAVINHFTAKIEANCIISSKPLQQNTISTVSNNKKTCFSSINSVLNVMETIEKEAIEWPTDRLQKSPKLKFKYIEDEQTVEFFVPYVWRVIYKTVAIYFNCDSIKLF